MRPVHDAVKGHVTPISDDQQDDIRRRIRDRMVARGWEPTDYGRLGNLVGIDRRQVRKYLTDDLEAQSRAIPATFIALLERKGFAAARWLLLEDGLPDPMPPGEPEKILAEIRRLVAERPTGVVESPDVDDGEGGQERTG